MKTLILLFLTSFILIGSCESKKSTAPEPKVIIDAQPEPLKEVPEEVSEAQYKKLIFNTKLSISPKQPNWVLFSNGTYILFPNTTSESEMRQSAFGFLQRYNNESLKVTKSPLVNGWIAGSKKGVYNYVSLEQAGDRMLSDQKLSQLGKQNIIKDKENPIIVHVNTAN